MNTRINKVIICSARRAVYDRSEIMFVRFGYTRTYRLTARETNRIIAKLEHMNMHVSVSVSDITNCLYVEYTPTQEFLSERSKLVKLLDPNENPPDDWEECPVCNSYHPLNYASDCRDNVNRWPFNPIHVDNVSNYLKRDQYIDAIKYYRMETGATLQEGKQFVDRFLDR